MPPLKTNRQDKQRQRQFTFSGTYLLLTLAAFWLLHTFLLSSQRPDDVSYTRFLHLLKSGKIEKVELGTTEIRAILKSEEQDGDKSGRQKIITTTRLPDIDETPLLQELESRSIEFRGKIETTPWWQQLLIGWVLPLGLLAALYWGAMRRLGKGIGPLSVGRSRAKIYDLEKDNRVTFADVAGVEEAEGELVEIVNYLKEPEKYQKLGARVPKGVLLVGPPGTGKTLLARAVAGEADVSFFSLSGSEFVEMFVGVGASRVRDLFVQAKERAPCIVFIDELDAIGKSRGGLGAMATHDEREQTLNQLLAEMDGFDAGRGVVIMAATNRPEVLDPALLRAGRFDRQVVVDRPDIKGREDILKVHVRKVKLAEEVDLHTVAQRTPGMVGADLANVVNEAALAATRREGEHVELRDFEEAIDRIQLGLQKKNRVMNEEEKRRVAYHEAGHALVALSVKHADPVHRVSIIPRSIGALGVTLQLPTEERYIMTKGELIDRIAVMFGGRCAEEEIFGDVSTGAENDIERATETARQMICRFGMSDKLGPVKFGSGQVARFLNPNFSFGDDRNFSEETSRIIDAEVREMIETQRARALAILRERREVLEQIAVRLLEKETLDREELEGLLPQDAQHGPESTQSVQTT